MEKWHLKFILSEKGFKNEDLEFLNHLETVEYLMHLMPYAVIKICKNYNFLDTNISRASFISSVLKLKFSKPTLLFCVMPVKYARGRVKPDKQNIKDFLNKIYYSSPSGHIDSKNIRIDIKNASKKPRIAEK
ncbi:MAG: hypothetical protein LBS81_00210 [Endomicrobium sp.]|jgi:hypothetical protein|nr:hypothetical protein [Endomicrobium sp.]